MIMKTENESTYKIGNNIVTIVKNYKIGTVEITVSNSDFRAVEHFSSWEEFESFYKQIDELVKKEKEELK